MAKVFVHDLQPGQVYGLQVRSNDGESVSGWSPITYFTTQASIVGPANVTGLTWVSEGTSFIANWNPVTTNTDGSLIQGQVRYEVIVDNGVHSITYIETQPRFEFLFERNREAFSGIPQASLTISVKAMNSSNVKSPAAASAFAENPQPAPPTDFEATEYTNQVVVSWEPSPDDDVVAYIMYADEGAGFVPAEGNMVWSGAGFTAIHHSTAYSTDFYYKVMAIDVFGTASDPLVGGPYSPLGISGTIDDTPPSNPTGVTATTAANADPSGQFTDLTVAWTGPTEASDTSLSTFNVRYGYDGTTWNYVKVPSDQLTAKIPRLLAGGSIYVQVQAEDFSANRSAWVNAGTYPVAAGKDTTFTETPAAPTVSVSTLRAQVSHTLGASPSGSLPTDLDYFEVYASTSSGFTPSSSNMLGTMKVTISPALAVETFDIPASAGSGSTQTWYFKVRGVDLAGNKSAYSAQATGAVGLIASANIADLAVTTAKIQSLEAQKITAGTGLVNDLTVKSILTLGDASTVGAVQTFGYSAGVTGARFDKNLIEINQGSIAAAALRIQNSPNLLPNQYGGFEYSSGYYTIENGIFTDNATIALDTATKKYESQSLHVTWTSTPAMIYLGNAVDDYNIPVEPGDYIFSIYGKNDEGSSETVTFDLLLDNATVVSGVGKTIASGGAWQTTPMSQKFTVPSGVSKALVRISGGTSTGNIHLDGAMIERKTGSTDLPSTWKPGSQITTIDGGMMRTGLVDADMLKAQAITTKILEGEYATFDWFGSKLVVSRELTTAESGRRWWAGPAGAGGQETGGMKMFDDAGFAYIDFPDNGNPAEFKGGVNALTLDVSGESKLAQTQLGKGQTFILNMGTTPPTTAPSVTPSYETFTVNPADESTIRSLSTIFAESDVPNWKYVRGFHVDATEILVMEWKFNDDGVEAGWLWIYDRATRNCLRRMTYGSITNWEFYGITKIGTRYFTLFNQPSDQLVYEIFPHTGIGTKTLRYQAGSAGFTNIGNDGTNLLLSSETSSTYRYRVLNVTTWTIGAQQIQTLADPDPDPGNHTVGILTGNFDFGAARIVVAGMSSRYIYSFSSGTEQTGEKWPVRHASSIIMRGLSHDGTNFYTVADDGLITKYSNIKWTTGSSTVWAAVKWRNTLGNGAGTAYETAVGKEKSITMAKRSFLTISHPNVPPDNDPVVPNDEPDSIGIYIARQASKPTTVGEWKFQSATNRFVAGQYFTTLNFTGNTEPSPVTGFPAASPSKIISTVLDGSGNPLIDIRADGFSRMNQLVVNSSVDANANPGNAPALRIGSITGNHLRIDGNEILSMDSDSVQGYLILNQNGESRAYQFQANTVTGGPQRAAAPYAKIYRTSSGSWANNTSATVPLVLDEETDATFGDTANNRLVCPIDGIYMFIGSVEWQAAAGNRRELSLFKNGVQQMTQKLDGVTGVTTTTNQIYWFGRCVTGDIFRIDAYQNSGAAINMIGGINGGTFLVGRWMAP